MGGWGGRPQAERLWASGSCSDKYWLRAGLRGHEDPTVRTPRREGARKTWLPFALSLSMAFCSLRRMRTIFKSIPHVEAPESRHRAPAGGPSCDCH